MILRNVSHWPDNTVSCTRTQYGLPLKTKIPYLEQPPCLIPHRSGHMQEQCIGKDNIKKGSKQTGCEGTDCICWPLIRRWWTFHLTHLMFSQRYSWWIESSGMLWCVDWEIIPDVSNRCNPLIFRIKQSLDYFSPKIKALCYSETSLFISPHSVNTLRTGDADLRF
jgi:hypothetical protein